MISLFSKNLLISSVLFIQKLLYGDSQINLPLSALCRSFIQIFFNAHDILYMQYETEILITHGRLWLERWSSYPQITRSWFEPQSPAVSVSKWARNPLQITCRLKRQYKCKSIQHLHTHTQSFQIRWSKNYGSSLHMPSESQTNLLFSLSSTLHFSSSNHPLLSPLNSAGFQNSQGLATHLHPVCHQN